MSSAICFSLDQCKILSSGKGLNMVGRRKCKVNADGKISMTISSLTQFSFSTFPRLKTSAKTTWIMMEKGPLTCAPPCWLRGECVRLITLWLWARDPVETKFLSSVFSPLTSAEACEKSSRWLWKEISVSTGVRKPGNTCASPTTMIWP